MALHPSTEPKKEAKKAPKADAADLAARIRSGGNIIEQIERWALDAAPDKKEPSKED